MLKLFISELVSKENEDYDLREKALFYCNLLKHDRDGLQKFLENGQEPIDFFMEDPPIKEVRDRIDYSSRLIKFPSRKTTYLNLMSFFQALRSLVLSTQRNQTILLK